MTKIKNKGILGSVSVCNILFFFLRTSFVFMRATSRSYRTGCVALSAENLSVRCIGHCSQLTTALLQHSRFLALSGYMPCIEQTTSAHFPEAVYWLADQLGWSLSIQASLISLASAPSVSTF